MTETDALIPYESLSLTGERIILIGGSGFIGHNLADLAAGDLKDVVTQIDKHG